MGISSFPLNTDATPPADPPAADDVPCDGWWPAINLAVLRENVRLDPTATPRLRDAARQAMLDIAGELADWRVLQEAAGHASLAAVPARIKVDGQSDYVLRWRRAVEAVVAADLGERSIGQQVTSAGLDRAEALQSDVDRHHRNVRHAVRSFLGKPRIVAELL